MAVEPAELDYQFIRLTTKPTAQICYSFQVPASSAVSSTKPLLVVFLNGLGLPQTSWAPLIVKLKELRPDTSMPMTLTYDRFGQGQTTDRDPQDERASDPMHAHDCMSAIKDLRQLIVQITAEMMGIVDTNKVTLVFVSNSIGCALTRLYVQEYPGTVAGILLLDSVLANSDFVSVFPDPDSEGNKEGLSRKNLSSLLPKSDSPVLKGVDGRGPYVTVVGHDFETFAEQGEKMGSPKALAMNYTNPYWHAYNQGLSKITEPARSKGPLQAPGCGHFVQQDNPAFVAQELDEILSNVM
ncbi:Alpha/Beta hydrolase protein [Lipomyces doorenjongii]